MKHFLLAILGLSLPLGSWATGIEYVRAQASPSALNAGEPLVYTVEVMLQGEQNLAPDIVLPELEDQFQVGEATSRSNVNIFNGRTRQAFVKEVRLIANHTGGITIPPARVLMPAAGGQEEPLLTNPVQVQVRAASGAEALPTPTAEIEILRPIKRSAHLSPSQWMPFMLGLMTLVAGLGVLTYVKQRPLPAPEEPAEPADPRLPDQRALDELGAALALKQAGRLREYFTALSAVLRRYLAEQFDFKAEELTTRELLAEMERIGFYSEFLARLRACLLECDQVKFANVLPAQPAVDRAGQCVRDLVQEPRKRPEPEPAPEPAPETLQAGAEPAVPAGQESEPA